MLRLEWIKCKGGNWCNFDKLKLETVNGCGVYIIWRNPGLRGGIDPFVLYVGQGEIAKRLSKHRIEKRFCKVPSLPRDVRLVTWAETPRSSWDGVERYLADTLHPHYGNRHPDVAPIEVNLPSAQLSYRI